MFCYLFEAKSIQNYLFSSGKLKDVIAASERLDNLIDSNPKSILKQVLDCAKIKSDLEDKNNSNQVDSDEIVHFLRCKGGAFYCYANKKNKLLALRSLWTLTVQQLFPSLEYTDALTQADSLNKALDKAHSILAQERNTPKIKYPIATAPALRYQRTGNASVPLSSDANKETGIDDKDVDIDTELHRQAYNLSNLKNNSTLQKKFLPKGIEQEICFPIDLEKEFIFKTDINQPDNTQEEAIKDIALIHIDGNGLGILLMALKDALKDKKAEEYRHTFRSFSDALNKATIAAAQEATKDIYDKIITTDDKTNKQKIMLPMRPIVLGGDDITLLCRADLALDFSKKFCTTFKSESEKELSIIFKKHLLNNKENLKDYLTASGGILYNKAGHPFINSHHIVEDLCSIAKKLTKSINNNDKQVGPAALAFHRLSSAGHGNFNEMHERILLQNKVQTEQIAYFVSSQDSSSSFNLDNLSALVTFSSKENTPVSISRWRQMLTYISMNDIDEANRIYHRGRELATSDACKNLDKLLDALIPENCTSENKWYWTTNNENNGKYYSIINDLLIMHRFKSSVSNNVQIKE